MDGLLLDTEAVYCRTNIEYAKKWGLKGYDKAHYLTELGQGEAETYRRYYVDFPETSDENIENFIKETRESIHTEFTEIGAPIKPGVFELLDYLKAEEIPCVVASSNNRGAIEVLLENAKMADYFTGIVSGDDVTHAKPHPEIVEKAIALLGAEPDELVMLEDSLNGIRASHTAKVPVVMIPDLLPPNDEAREKTVAIYPSLHEYLASLQEK